jgi:hypothetical protein
MVERTDEIVIVDDYPKLDTNPKCIVFYQVPLGISKVQLCLENELTDLDCYFIRKLKNKWGKQFTRIDLSFSNGWTNSYLFGNLRGTSSYIGVLNFYNHENAERVVFCNRAMPNDIADFVIGKLTQANLLERFVLECGKPTK